MKRGKKKSLNLSRLLVMLLVVLFGSSAFAMQQLQWSPLRSGEAVAPPAGRPLEERVLQQEYEIVATDFLPPGVMARQNVEEPADQQQNDEEKNEAEIIPAQNNNTKTNQANKSSNTTAPRQQRTAAVAKEDKPAAAKVAQPEVKKVEEPKSEEPKQKESAAPEQTEKTEADKPAAVAEPQQKTEEKVEVVTTPASPYRVLSSSNHRMLSKIVVKNTGDEVSKNVRIEVPLVTTSSFYLSRREEKFSVKPEVKTVNGTRVGVFSLGDLEPGEEAVVEIRTVIRTSNVQFFADYVPTEGKTITSFLGAAGGIESTNSQIVSRSNSITSGMTSDWDKARAITRWVATNIKYDASAANRNSGALSALQSGRGVCEDYAKLCAALGRAANIPTRVVYGYTDSGSKWPSKGSFSLSGYRHAWVEYYLYGRGWVPAEPTRSTSSKLYFGTLPHNRYIIQNYSNISLSGKYKGGKLSISWADSLY